MNIQRCLILLATATVVLASCNREQRPEGFPDLRPFSIKIVQEGTPLEGASVALISSDPALMK